MKKLLLAAVLWAVASPVVSAECGPRKEMLWKAKSKRQEQISISVIDDQHVFETWANRSTSPFWGTWTIFITDVHGETCLWRRGNGRMMAQDV